VTSSETTSATRKAALALLAAPLLWLVPAFLHPTGEPYEGIAGDADLWISVHVAQLVLAPFLAAGVWMLLRGIRSVPAHLARAALALWMVFFSAFDAVAGIATGVLTRHANTLAGTEREGVVAAIDFLWADSTLASGGFSVLGNLGHFSWVAAALAAAVALHRAGAARVVVGATVLSVLFASHSGVGAAVGLIALFTAGLLTLRRQSLGKPLAAATETGASRASARSV
jgi:hypothetical protein